MKSILEFRDMVRNKAIFTSLEDYIDFAYRFVDFISDSNNIEAKIVSRNENNYRFLQYKKEATFNITRPINYDLYLDADNTSTSFDFFTSVLSDTVRIQELSPKEKELFNKCIYTIQQSIGCALDALPASDNNVAKKINGDLFERLMLLIFKALQFDVNSMSERVTLKNVPDFKVNYRNHPKLAY